MKLQQFKVGDKVKHSLIPDRGEGIITEVDQQGFIVVKWDSHTSSATLAKYLKRITKLGKALE